MILKHQQVVDRMHRRARQQQQRLALNQRMDELAEKYAPAFWAAVGVVLVLVLVLQR